MKIHCLYEFNKYISNFFVIIIPIFILNFKIFSSFSVIIYLNLINNKINNDSSSFIEIIRINNEIQFYKIVVKILFIAEKKNNRYIAINAYRTSST